jgi:hypothetical protein
MSEEKVAADRTKLRAHYSSVKDATIWGASFIAFVAVLIMLLLLLFVYFQYWHPTLPS